MDVRSIIALFLGLVIQLSQVPTRALEQPVKSCVTQAHSMACCEGLAACPCANDGSPDQQPAPVIPAAVDLKLAIAKPSEPGSERSFASALTETTIAAISQMEVPGGYAGVPLSVAFCTFVI